MYHFLRTVRTPLPIRCHRAVSTTVPSQRLGASALETSLRRVGYVVLFGVVGYVADREFYASTAARNLRTFWTVRIICTIRRIDY